MTDFYLELLQLHDDADHLRELLHEHFRERESYGDCYSAWFLLYRNYAEQLERAETRLADLLRRESPQVLQLAP
jgi:hypothetical protein